MLVKVEHPHHRPTVQVNCPIKFSDDPCRMHRPPPVLGADTDAILAELGRDDKTIKSLRAARVI